MRSRGFTLMETVMFIVLAALIIPIFYLTTQPVIKDMMTPTTYIKARFIAQKKMEELVAYSFTDAGLAAGGPGGFANVTTDTAFPAAEYAGYQWQWAINYLDCNNPAPIDPAKRCVGYVGNVLTAVPNPPAYTTNYKQIDLTVAGPQGATYRATSLVTARY
jgi:hypothetical protein